MKDYTNRPTIRPDIFLKQMDAEHCTVVKTN